MLTEVKNKVLQFLHSAILIVRYPAKSLMAAGFWVVGKKVRSRSLLSEVIGTANEAGRRRDQALRWCDQNLNLTEDQIWQIRNEIKNWSDPPVISIILPVFNTPEKLLRAALASVKEQLYSNWQLCIADDASTAPHVRAVLQEAQSSDNRIFVSFRTENGHISAASNSAIDLATGDFFALMDHDDLLPPQSLYHAAKEILAHPESDLFYSDEALLGEDGVARDIHFKPDWNEELFLAQNYINHLSVLRANIVRRIGGFRKGLEGSQDHDLLLRFVAETSANRIRHIPQVLYLWRVFSGSGTFSDKSLKKAEAARRTAVQEYLNKKGIRAEVVRGPGGFNRVKRQLNTPLPLVSLIVPTRDRLELTRACIDGLLNRTDYPNLEVILVDNDSVEPRTLRYFEKISHDPRVRILQYAGAFNYSAINNFAVIQACGDIIGLINNDIDVINTDWLREMVAYAVDPQVGAVGAKLLYPDNRIQHAGVILGIGGVAGHSHKKFGCDDRGHFWRPQLAQYISAVTGACLVIRREAFLMVGGLNARDLEVAYNDVDLCLKLRENGLKNLYTPYATLYHKESASRGGNQSREKAARFRIEHAYMKKAWGRALNHDPYYNPNLTLLSQDFSFSARTEKSKKASPNVRIQEQIPDLFYIHVPKTGGTSIATYLKTAVGTRHFLDHCETYLQDDRCNEINRFKVAGGHVRLHELLSSGIKYKRLMTSVRAPRAQLISHIDWLIHIGKKEGSDFFNRHPEHIRDAARKLAHTDFSDAKALEVYVSNMTNTESGLFDNFLVRFLSPVRVVGRVKQEHVDAATEALTKFDFIVMTETLHKDMNAAFAKMGYALPKNEILKNIGSKRSTFHKIKDNINSLEPLFKYDLILQKHIYTRTSDALI